MRGWIAIPSVVAAGLIAGVAVSTAQFTDLSNADRRAIVDILRDTKKRSSPRLPGRHSLTPRRQNVRRNRTMRTAIIGAFVAAATTLVAAPQQTTYRPGDLTKPEVFVQNRGAAEAIPVDLRQVNTETPLRVQVVGTPASQPLPVRLVRPVWEYKAVVVAQREDA